MEKIKTSSLISTDGNSDQGCNTWFTPKKFSTIVDFDLDPCTESYRPHDMAKRSIEFDRGGDGLIEPWEGSVWLNPPYGRKMMPWIEKFIQHKDGVLLIFARMGSEPVQQLLKAGAYIYLLRNRIKFISKDGLIPNNAGADSCLVFFYYSKYAEKIQSLFPGILVTKYPLG